MEKKVIHVRIDADLKGKFDAICKEGNINASALVRSWVEKFIEESEGEGNGKGN